MSKCAKLLAKARNNPDGVRFDDVCALAECVGFEFSRQRGSHRMFKLPGSMTVMNFQNRNGYAKPYQVKQLIKVIDELGLSYE